MGNDVTYGSATLLARAYHDRDIENFDFLRKAIDLPELVSSTFQLCYLLLYSIPRGRLESNSNYDLREEAFDYFAEVLSTQAIHASSFSGIDPLYLTTATTTIVMENVLPLTKGDYDLSVSMEYEGIDDRGFHVLMAFIANAALQTFQSYASLIGPFSELNEKTTYIEASDELLRLLPLAISHMNKGNS